MESIGLTVSVLILFLIRIGIPVLLLIILGTLIDRWQTAREKNIHNRYLPEDQQPATH